MSDTNLYPWLDSYWQKFLLLKSQDRIPHGLMIRSMDGLGKKQLAKHMANSLLCQSPINGFACGQCSDCKLLEASTHPDLHLIELLEDKKQISIDQIRQVVQSCSEKPHQGGYRIVIINPADAMNTASANALLKTLEEPGKDTVILLLTDTNNFLPATLRSRCQLVNIAPPSQETGLKFLNETQPYESEQQLLALRLASYAPLKARTILQTEELHLRQKFLAGLLRASEGKLEPIKLTSLVLKTNISDVLDWLYSIILDCQKLNQQVGKESILNQDQLKLLQKLSIQNNSTLDGWLKQILEARRLATSSSNINQQLLIEDLMFRWIAIFK